jgi:class 3 adenylate cyclase
VGQLNDELRETNPEHEDLVLRMGMETGPVVAGVIGRSKFAFDIWGMTVNVASRMETTGLPGFIQVTERVHHKLNGDYLFVPRGEVYAKGAGTMNTYFLLGMLVPGGGRAGADGAGPQARIRRDPRSARRTFSESQKIYIAVLFLHVL